MNREQENLVQRGRIVGLHEAGMSISAIANEVGMKRDTVSRWIKRWNESGDLRDKPRSGCPRKTTREQDEAIANEARNQPITNARIIKNVLNIDVSLKTIRRRLNDQGIRRYAPAVKEKLTEIHRNRRLQFSQEHVNWSLNDWARVVFTDEKTFFSTSHGKLHCYRLRNERFERANIYEQARSGHVTANMWGWIHLYGVGELAEIEGRFNAEQYLEILEEVMLPSVRAIALPHPEIITFMHVSIFYNIYDKLNYILCSKTVNIIINYLKIFSVTYRR